VVAPYPSKNMKKPLFYTFALFTLFALLVSCGGNEEIPTPLTLKGAWKATTVQINGTGQNLASAGQPYANFQIVIDGTSDDNGSYTVSGMPLPFAASFAGNWTKSGNTFTFSTGAPNGITSLTNFSASGTNMSFVMVQNHPKVNVTLHFTMTKQ
jgi:hypothetical protein